ncbi:alpha/beta hydrolase [Haloferula sp. BvORR071]|uniref:alpha/beta hydrolase n=1 Tax=Haloferula sp. BvORR071 TaxID=1396141 RepID=UPI000A8F6039|nr:alpha/beta hydrolase [Haloferula sp. BvORR071]
MKPTIAFPFPHTGRLALLLAASSSISLTPLYAADGPEPGVNSPVAGEEAIKGSEVHTPPAEPKAEAKAEAPRAKPNDQMQAVLDQLTALGGKPVTELSPKDARKQPSPADAVKKVMEKNGVKADKSGKTDNVSIKLSTGSVDGRVYRPEGDGPFPVILYIHGGGWVLADLDTYDASAHALSKSVHALVISTDYRHAPEHKFPAAHEDVFGAYQWTLENAGKWSGDASRVAVVGESAGGNMAVALSMMAQDKGMQMPIHQVLVYPVATTAMDGESYRQHAQAAPLNAAMMKWFFDQTLSKVEDWKNHQINLLEAKTLAGLPPTTIITADIDPLRSDGEMLAKKLEADGVKVDYKNYEGVTHEFFGMGAVVGAAQDAMDFAAANLKAAFDGKDKSPAIGKQPPAVAE